MTHNVLVAVESETGVRLEGDGLAAKVCLARSTPDETPACAASRRNATRCGG